MFNFEMTFSGTKSVEDSGAIYKINGSAVIPDSTSGPLLKVHGNFDPTEQIHLVIDVQGYFE